MNLFHVLARVVHKTDDVVVVEGVEREPARAAHPHEARGAQQAQLMRHGRLGLADERGEIADAALAVGQHIDETNASRIAQELEDVGHRFNRPTGQQPVSYVRKRGRVSGVAFRAADRLIGGSPRGHDSHEQ